MQKNLRIGILIKMNGITKASSIGLYLSITYTIGFKMINQPSISQPSDYITRITHLDTCGRAWIRAV